MSDYILDKSEGICETDGDFFKEMFEMERQVIAEVKAEIEAEKKKNKKRFEFHQ